MQTKSDAQLLREYAEHGAETAFAEIVSRHTNLVYSAALRQVDSPDLAADVAQSVFVGLARAARSLSRKLADSASLAGWLCRSARNISLNLRRDEFRRHSRERQAMENLDSIPDATPDWERLRPVLDEAMSELSEPDYDALLIRFFKNQDLRSVGLALGVSDDAAQKRVSRALDKLRDFLSRRGIRTSAAPLSIILSANAVQAAPAGLIVTISTAAALAGSAGQTSTAIAASKAVAMTTIQKTIIGTTFATVIGAGIYEARQASGLRDDVKMLQQQHAPLTTQVGQLRRQRDDATTKLTALLQENERLRQDTTELAKLRGEIARLRKDSQDLAKLQAVVAGDQTLSGAASWKDRVSRLKERLEQSPGAKIPELQFVTEKDWLQAAQGELETDADFRRALSSLRSTAENKVAQMMKTALTRYLRNNSKQFPSDLAQLQPYFDSPLDDSILQRWEIAPAQTVKSLGMGGDVIITQKAPVDDVFDTRFGIGPNGFGSTDFLSREIAHTMDPVWEAFRNEHNGEWPEDVSQLHPYAKTSEQQLALQKLMLKRSSDIK